MKILAIETSCDETAIALISVCGKSASDGRAKDGLGSPINARPQLKILKNFVASQIKIHRPFGGVVPTLAKREHLKNLPFLFKKLIGKNSAESNFLWPIDLIAVTTGPGLEPCLWTGIEFAKELYRKVKKINPKSKIIGVNHLKGHLYSFLLSKEILKYKKLKDVFPAVALIVSGGHTILLLMKNLTEYRKLGETRDDAAGESFDKVARLLNLPYPGGPEIEKISKKGNEKAVNFPRPMINQKNYDFSFSGLKTAVFYYLRDNQKKETINKADIAASFQQAVIDVLTAKTIKAAKEFKAKTILVSGGVAANKKLRLTLKKEAKKNNCAFIAPPLKFNMDNAVMMALAAYVASSKKEKTKISAKGDFPL